MYKNGQKKYIYEVNETTGEVTCRFAGYAPQTAKTRAGARARMLRRVKGIVRPSLLEKDAATLNGGQNGSEHQV